MKGAGFILILSLWINLVYTSKIDPCHPTYDQLIEGEYLNIKNPNIPIRGGENWTLEYMVRDGDGETVVAECKPNRPQMCHRFHYQSVQSTFISYPTDDLINAELRINRVSASMNNTVWSLYKNGDRVFQCFLTISSLCFRNQLIQGYKGIITKYVENDRVKNGTLRWKVESVEGEDIVLAECQPENSPPCRPVMEDFHSFYESAIRVEGSRYKMTMTILKADWTRDSGIWMVYDGQVEFSRCRLHINYHCSSKPVVEGDILRLNYNNIPVKVDQSWTLQWRKTEDDGETVETECMPNLQSVCENYHDPLMFNSRIYHNTNSIGAELTIQGVSTSMNNTWWSLYNDEDWAYKCLLITSSSCTQSPVRDNTRATVTKYVEKDRVKNGILQWKVESVEGEDIVLAECQPENSPPCRPVMEDFNSFYEIDLTDEGGRYKVSITILRANRIRDQAIWRLFDGQDEYGRCQFYFYSFSTSKCGTIQVSTDGILSWLCSTYRVYPDDLECGAYYRDGPELHHIDGFFVNSTIQTSLGSYPPRTAYHELTCTLSMNISEIPGIGIYEFYFNPVFLVIIDGYAGSVASGTPAYFLQLEYPQVKLSNCPNVSDHWNGYISENSSKTCGCVLVEPGTPHGLPQWRDSHGNIVGDLESKQMVSQLNLAFDPTDLWATFTCRGVSILGAGREVAYNAKYAYGPSRVLASSSGITNSTFILDRCDPDEQFFLVMCDVTILDVNPKPTVTLQGDKEEVAISYVSNEITDTGLYRYLYYAVPRRMGVLTLECRAHNSANSYKTVMDGISVTVREPAMSEIAMTINGGDPIENGGHVTLTSGDKVKVGCDINEDYREAAQVTVTCAGVSTILDSSGDRVVMVVDKGDNGMKCLCVVSSATNLCHGNGTGVLTLDVRYKPAVTSFVANSNHTELTVTPGKLVTFECHAEGNPRPVVNVIGQRSKDVAMAERDAQIGLYFGKTTVTKFMGCGDTDVYVCSADNGVSARIQHRLPVFVTCMTQFSPSFNNTLRDYKTTDGLKFDLLIPIIGHPPPTTFTLKTDRKQNSTREKNSLIAEEVDDHSYSVVYVANDPPEGTVFLQILSMGLGDTGLYVLTIANGVGSGLDYTFHVTVNAEVTTDDDEDNVWMPTSIGIGGVAIGVVICVIVILVRWTVLKRRQKRPGIQKSNGSERNNDNNRQQSHDSSNRSNSGSRTDAQAPQHELDSQNAQVHRYDLLRRSDMQRATSTYVYENIALDTRSEDAMTEDHYRSISSAGIYVEAEYNTAEVSGLSNPNEDDGYLTPTSPSQTEDRPSDLAPISIVGHDYANWRAMAELVERQ